MKKTIVLPLIALFCAAVSSAQTKTNFRSSVNAGLLLGEGRSALQLQTVSGIQYRTWFFGAGVGIDDYELRSVPVFAAVRKALGKSAKSSFLYLDGGYHMPWLTKANKEAFIEEANGGLYCETGIGFYIPLRNDNRLSFSAGYSLKRYQTEETPSVVIAVWPAPILESMRFDYTARRVAVKIGLTF